MFYKTVLRINKNIGDYENSVKIESAGKSFTKLSFESNLLGTWGPSDWTAFKKAIRSNNDVEDKTEDFDGKCSNEVSYTDLSVAYQI